MKIITIAIIVVPSSMFIFFRFLNYAPYFEHAKSISMVV